MKEQVEKWLAYMRPAFQRHKGDIALVDVDEASGIVRVRLEGACKGCEMSMITMKAGVEATLVAEVPGVKEVIAISDEVHAIV
ncbi:MAG: NifU family protein [Patescibacteria group bacterium]